jgi:acyl carrier protein
MKSIETEVYQFVLENFLFGDKSRALDLDQSFLDSGIVDSTGVLELIAFAEEQYGIKVNDEDLLPENFDSIKNISGYIQSKILEMESASV